MPELPPDPVTFRMTRREFVTRAVPVVPGTALAASVLSRVSGSFGQAHGSAEMESVLEPIREAHDLPALAAAVVRDGRVAASAAVGFRKYGSDVRVTAGDHFHLGSCTKAMTATLIAQLVEQGKLSWETTLGQVFPALASGMHPDRRDVTVEMLLAHRGGFPSRSAPEGKSLLQIHRLPGEPREQRRAYLEMFLREAPEEKPGAKYVYSNAGYTVLGAIAERVTDTAWETLMRRRLFQPLGMESAGFGAMGRPGRIDQPWQHRLDGNERRPVEPGPLSDNPPAIGPAGTVHCSVGDWAKFVAAHVREGGGEKALLKPETFRRLHTPPLGGDYFAGWIVTERGWGGGRVLTHAGSNTMSFAVVWAAPLKQFAVVVATNQAGGKTPQACDEAAAALIRRFLTST